MNINLILIAVIAILVVYIIIDKHEDQLRHNRILFKDKLRNKWEQHAFWTRELGILILGGADKANIDTTVAGIGKAQTDIIDLIITESYKDKSIKIDREKIKTEFTDLFNNHTLIVAEIILDLKENKDPNVEKLKNNTEEIAKVLDSLSKWISLNKVRDLFGNYTNTTLAQFISYKNKEWETSVYNFDSAISNVIKLSDHLSDALSYD